MGERYHVLELIGEGSFGRVYKGRRKFTKQVRIGSFVVFVVLRAGVCAHRLWL